MSNQKLGVDQIIVVQLRLRLPFWSQCHLWFHCRSLVDWRWFTLLDFPSQSAFNLIVSLSCCCSDMFSILFPFSSGPFSRRWNGSLVSKIQLPNRFFSSIFIESILNTLKISKFSRILYTLVWIQSYLIASDRKFSIFPFFMFFFLFSCFLFLGFPKFSCFPYHNESIKFLQGSGGERRKSKASIHVVWKCWSKVFAPKSAPFSLPLSCSCGVVRLWFSLISNPEPFIARLFDYWTLLTVVGRVDEFTNADYETCCRLSSWSVELISEDYGTCWKLSEGRRRDQCRPMKTMEPVVDRRKDLQEQSDSVQSLSG